MSKVLELVGSGTMGLPVGTVSVEVEMVGGGAGGGGVGGGAGQAGGGGGSSGVYRRFVWPALANPNIGWACGAAGAGGAAGQTGLPGERTLLAMDGFTVVAEGGQPGCGASGAITSVGIGGGYSSLTPNLLNSGPVTQGAGHHGGCLPTGFGPFSWGGIGGGTPLGEGGRGTAGAFGAGGNATGWGAGGGGALGSDLTPAVGGNGSHGGIFITIHP
jgi:hypothetical protein